MKNINLKKIILILCVAIILLSSCTNTKTPDDVNETTVDTSETRTVSSATSSNYDKIRFGETKKILLLDIEWHTPESYEEMRQEQYKDVDDAERLAGMMQWTEDYKTQIQNEEIYISKTVNGKKFELYSVNTYNNNWNWDTNDISQIDPDGYYIYNMYPFGCGLGYNDENGEWQPKYFTFESELDFCLKIPGLISYCDELLSKGHITPEQYENYIIKSPLDYYVRRLDWFNEEDLKNHPLEEYDFPPTPELIKDKKEFNILFVGNSLTDSGVFPKQVSKLSEIYEITVEYDSVTQGGADLNVTMDKAIKKMQENKYDYAVFQDGVTRPLSDTAGFWDNIETLCEEARKSGAIPVILNPSALMNDSPLQGDQRDYQNGITQSCENAAKLYGAVIVNAAEACVYAYTKHPDLSLYMSKNDSHPNNAGAYLMACTFISTLFDIHVKDIAETNTYRSDDAVRIGQAAWEYVNYYNEHKKFPEEIVTVPDGTNERIALIE